MPLKEESFERINFGNWENCYTFASHITDYRTVRWVSGLNQQFAGYRTGGSNPPLTAKGYKEAAELALAAFLYPFARPAARRAGMCDRREQIPPVRILGAWLLGCATAGSSDIV